MKTKTLFVVFLLALFGLNSYASANVNAGPSKAVADNENIVYQFVGEDFGGTWYYLGIDGATGSPYYYVMNNIMALGGGATLLVDNKNIIPLDADVEISSSTTEGEWASETSNFTVEDWGGKTAFIGMRFGTGENFHYGWLRFKFNADRSEGIIVDYAYNSVAGASILTGEGAGELNYEPKFTSNPVKKVLINELYEYNVLYSDADEDDTLTLTAVEIPDWLNLVEVDNGESRLYGTPTEEGIYDVSLKLSDGKSEVYQNFKIKVLEGEEEDEIIHVVMNKNVNSWVTYAIDGFPSVSYGFSGKDNNALVTYANARIFHSGDNNILKYDEGAVIGDETDGEYSTQGWVYLPDWTNQTKFIGIRFTDSGDTYYGWMRISYDGTDYVLVDYAYNKTEGASIITGDVGDGSIVDPDPDPDPEDEICHPDADNYYVFIKKVKFGNMTSITPISSYNDAFVDYTADATRNFVLDLDESDTYTMYVTPSNVDSGEGDTYTLHAYVDWNGDNVFAANETESRKVVINEIGEAGAFDDNPFEFEFTIPENAEIDEWVTMRVLLHYGTTDNGPCGSYETAQYQDYKLKVTATGTSTATNKLSDVALYPNPTNGIVNIVGSDEVTNYSVYSMDSRLMRAEMNNNNVIDISSYPQGMYLIKMNTAKGVVTQKVVLK